MGSEAFTVSLGLDTRCDGRSETDIDEPSNIAVEQIAGSRSLAAAAHGDR